MKVLFVGASGAIGSKVLEQCLAHPGITTVVAFVRRELLTSISNHNKLECVIKKDFARWEDDELQGHADAVAMVWYVQRGYVSSDDAMVTSRTLLTARIAVWQDYGN